ncbi:SDR family NAD(P)-dependent oxidoreductase [Streptomyces sp. NPDC059991]|uniref:SDR family NAD(P)-dependent oxidoreductase n=1 Tax=Streptomyces sp. NPDC059991 TaxID=3347028 RepID=UPI003678CA05
MNTTTTNTTTATRTTSRTTGIVVVTGAGTGTGRATARAFADEGAHVLAIGRRAEPLPETAADRGGSRRWSPRSPPRAGRRPGRLARPGRHVDAGPQLLRPRVGHRRLVRRTGLGRTPHRRRVRAGRTTVSRRSWPPHVPDW